MSDEQDPGGGGDYVGVYRLEKRLGKGGMGEVFLAYDERLDRRVAVKRIRHQAEAGARQRERFRREARAAAKLSHPAIAQVYDVVFGDAGDSIVMEYVEGRTLGQLLAAGEIDAAGALRAAVQVAEGLAAAHGKGFVHRDLKKENVMVTPEGQAKILDFGLAKELRKEEGTESLTERGALLGTVSSMSPEQAAGLPVDPRSDLFSFGVLLYETFTGRSPFRRENQLRTLQSVVHEDPPPPRALRPELPEELSTLIEALLEKDTTRRPETAGEVAVALRRIAGSAGLADLTLPSAEDAGESWMTAPSDAPTAWGTTPDLRPRPAVPRPTGGAPSTSRPPAAPVSRGRRRWAAAGIVALVLAAAVGIGLRWSTEDAVPELRVLVLEPETSSSETGDEGVDLTAFAVLESSLGTLASLEGIDAVKPSKVSKGSLTPEEAAKEVAADEVLEIHVECPSSWCLASFHRLRSDGVTLEVSERFEVSTRPEDSLDLTHAVGRYLQDAYPEHRPRPGTPVPEFRPEDYGEFLALRKRSESGQFLDEDDLERLAAVLESSPRLLAGHLLAAGVARVLRQYERALGFAETARELAPRDPRPFFQKLQVQLEMGEVDKAGATLGELERLAPGNLRVARSRADLLGRRGKLDEAVEAAREIVERRPSWRNVVALALYETRAGENDSAGGRLEELRKAYPDNPLILSRLASVEISRGELERAAEICLRLLAIRPRSMYFHNLGWIRFLLGDYDRAVEAFERALELGSDDSETRFNLGAAHQAAGREAEALELYRGVLQELEEDGARRRGIIEAQCLVRVDRAAEAVAIAKELIRESEDPQIIYQAAEIFTLAGDRISALYHLGKALDRGLSPRWLENPSFRLLADDPEFQKLRNGRSVLP